MTNIQESKFSMNLGMRDYFNNNTTISSKLPTFSSVFPIFNENLNLIQVFREQQAIDKSGISEQKQFLRIDLTEKTLNVSRKTEVYAKLTNNPILASEVHYSRTELCKSTDSSLKDKALLVYDRAMANIGNLSEYGINQELLNDLKSSIDLFFASIPTTRAGIAESKQVTEKLAGLFKSNDEIISTFDLLVEVVRHTEPEFYRGYKGIRKIIVSGSGSMALMVKVTDANSGEGIKGVKVSFILQKEPLNTTSVLSAAGFVKTTTSKGNFNIRNMANGSYTASSFKNGYKRQENIVNISSGDRAKLFVQLEKN